MITLSQLLESQYRNDATEYARMATILRESSAEKPVLDPSLLTRDEYMEIANPSRKAHGDNSYDLTMDQMQYSFGDPEDARLINNITIRGVGFRVMVQGEKIHYRLRDAEGNDVRIDGALQYMDDSAVEELGWDLYRDTFYVVNQDGKTVAAAQDEWGALLVVTAREYRGFGLGPLVGKLARTRYPTKDSGGFTPSGVKNFSKVHREMVRDALTGGKYSRMVRDGVLTMARVREIIDSAELSKRSKPTGISLATDDPKQWMLFDAGSGFILYVAGLVEALADDRLDQIHIERFIIGVVSVDSTHSAVDGLQITQLYGQKPSVMPFMLTLAHSKAKEFGIDLYIDGEDLQYAKGFELGPVDKSIGRDAAKVLSGPTFPYREMAEQEQKFRAAFDPYDEFLHQMWELGSSMSE